MKAIVIDHFGGAEQMHMMDMPVPIPRKTEVLIEIHYTSVNPVDWKIRSGAFKDMLPHRFPLILGWDAAGIVGALGPEARQLHVGDNVYAYCRKPEVQSGTYTEYVAVPEEYVALMPRNMGFREAAAIPLSGLTAWQGLFDVAKIKRPEVILIHGGAGGVGSLAIQLAKAAGTRVLTTATARHHPYLTSIGADEVIDYSKENFVETIRRRYPEGIDVVFDLVGGDSNPYFLVLRPGGRLVSSVERPNPKKAAQYGVQAESLFVRPDGKQLAEITSLIEEGKIQSPKTQEFSLEDAPKAHELSESHHVEGKLVVKVRD